MEPEKKAKPRRTILYLVIIALQIVCLVGFPLSKYIPTVLTASSVASAPSTRSMPEPIVVAAPSQQDIMDNPIVKAVIPQPKRLKNGANVVDKPNYYPPVTYKDPFPVNVSGNEYSIIHYFGQLPISSDCYCVQVITWASEKDKQSAQPFWIQPKYLVETNDELTILIRGSLNAAVPEMRITNLDPRANEYPKP